MSNYPEDFAGLPGERESAESRADAAAAEVQAAGLRAFNATENLLALLDDDAAQFTSRAGALCAIAEELEAILVRTRVLFGKAAS